MFTLVTVACWALYLSTCLVCEAAQGQRAHVTWNQGAIIFLPIFFGTAVPAIASLAATVLDWNKKD
jgi:hypothetical protein